ncbi:hypothetical protein [Kribbella lupini]|uniref:PPE family protein n=1 Tax=Kribbella lupini TaxID=291602 RepID=A0ABP4MB23_9ACTN
MTAHPQTFQELIKAHGKVALELSGAGQSAWNGIVKETDNGDLGMADWNGTLELDQVTVTDPLRQMYATPGAQHDAATLDGYRDAFATMLHEQSHFFGPVGASQQEAKAAFVTPGAQQLEEGVTEAWTQDNLNEYLTELGADQIAPGIENAYAQKAYPEFVPAARELAAGIGARTGQSEGEVLTALNAQTAAGQWSTATEMLYNSSNLPQVVPADQETNVKNAIEQVMRAEFERVDNLQNVGSHNTEILSASIGQDTVTAGLEEIHRQEQTFAPPEAATVQTPTVQTESSLAVAAETGPSLGVQDTPAVGSAGGQAAGGQAASGQAVGAQAAGGQAVGAQAAGGQAASGQAAGGQAAGGQATGGQAAGGQTSAGPTGPQVGAGGQQTAPGGPQFTGGASGGGQQAGVAAYGAAGAPPSGQQAGMAAYGAAAAPSGPQAGAAAPGGPQSGGDGQQAAGAGPSGPPSGAAGGPQGGAAGGPQRAAAGGPQSGAAADTARALALAQGGQRPLGQAQRLGQESFGSQRGGDQAAGRSQGAERPSGDRGGRGE